MRRSADILILGGGLIGLATARELHRGGARVCVLERGRPGREASWAGAGMLAAYQTAHAEMRAAAIASAEIYPAFVADLEAETGCRVGYRATGTIFVGDSGAGHHPRPEWEQIKAPHLKLAEGQGAYYIPGDHSVDNRLLVAALERAVRQAGIPIVEDCQVTAVRAEGEGMTAVASDRSYSAAVIVNAAGAWAGGITAPLSIPIRPRKGQLLSLRTKIRLDPVIAAPGVYIVPRDHGQVIVGATLEDVGFTPGTQADQVNRLHERAAAVLPELADAEVEASWFGYRPCAADELPVMGPSHDARYWLATGHFRDGILLTPLTALVVAAGVLDQLGRRGEGEAQPWPAIYTMKAGLSPSIAAVFSPSRFGQTGVSDSGQGDREIEQGNPAVVGAKSLRIWR